MKKKLNLEIGDICFTYGGWECIVIWKTKSLIFPSTYIYYTIHKPNTDEESIPIQHDEYGQAKNSSNFLIIRDMPPIYDQHHPADIAIWAKEEIEEAKKKSKQIMEKLNW